MHSTPQGSGVVGRNSIAYFYVDNIAVFYQQLVSSDAKFERELGLAAQMTDHELWLGFLKGQDQNLVALMEEIPK